MVPTHTTTADGPPRGRLGPPPFPHPHFYQQGHPPPQQGHPPPQQGHPPPQQGHPAPILHSSSHDYHASPLQYYAGMNQGYGYPNGGGPPGWENGGLPVPQSPHRDSNTNPYYQQPHPHPQHTLPQMLYPHQQLHQQLQQQRSDRPPPPSQPQPPIGFLDVTKQMAPPGAAGWRPRPADEETGSRAMPMQRPRDDSEDWVAGQGRPLFRQY
jgi:hypothetical protein